MNKLAWSITYYWNLDFSFEKSLSYIVNNIKDNVNNIFFIWETSIETSSLFVENFSNKLNWEILWYDISISSEDKINIFNNSDLEWKYSFLAINWLDFDTVFEKYKDIEKIVSIREAENSKILWNRVIKIDFIN